MKKLMFLLIALCLAGGTAVAQVTNKATGTTPPAGSTTVKADSVVMPRPRSSSIAIAAFKKPSIYIKAVYGQPLKRGREIFGALEPYGQVWRTGANEATEITTTKDLRIGGKTLKAGTYTLFTIPEKDKWKVLFNSELGQWGAFKYDPAKDVLVTEVPVTQTPETYEAFIIRFDETRTGADMVLAWDKTRVAVPLTFSK
jgi:hypothetical protein